MKIAKLNCPVISEALKDTEKFGVLHMYMCGIGGFERTEEGSFISKIVKYGDTSALQFKLALEDYFFNEEGREADELWKFAEELTGKQNIQWEILKIIEL